MATVVLAMAVTAITMPFTAGAQNQQEEARQTLAVNLAQEMMEEVMSKPFSDPSGTDDHETARAAFDNIADYDNYTEAAGNIASFDGEIVTDPAAHGLSRHVECKYVYVSGQDMNKPATFIRVTVNVSYGGKVIVTLGRLAYQTHQQGRAPQ